MSLYNRVRKFISDIPYWPSYLRYHYQRATRGWADSDVWDISEYFLEVVPQMLRRLRNTKSGYPSYFAIPERTDEQSVKMWDDILDEMIYGFELQRLWNEDYAMIVGVKKPGLDGWYLVDFGDPEWRALYEQRKDEVETAFNKSMKLFHKHFFSLWD